KTRRRLAQIRQEAGALLARTAAEAKQEDAPGPAAPPSVAPGQAAGREVPWPPRPGEPVWVRALQQAGELMHYLDEGRSAMVRLGALTMKVDVDQLAPPPAGAAPAPAPVPGRGRLPRRSEEHTSELQSRENLVCRLLL